MWHPATTALALNGFAMLTFGFVLLLMPIPLLKNSGFKEAISAPLILMHRITGIWVSVAGLASLCLASFEEVYDTRVACGVFALPHAIEVHQLDYS